MELQFVKLGGEWVAEFEATSDFNINLDRTNKGYLLIYLKGAADGTWATYPSYKNYKEAANIDVDVTALIYPKYIKVVSQSEVEKAIVTMDGESGGSGAGGGLRPVTADDVALFLTNEQYYDDSVKIEFQDTITIMPNRRLFIKQLNPLAELAVLYTPNILDSKTQVNIWIPTKELFIYNNNSQNIDFNIENVYIKD